MAQIDYRVNLSAAVYPMTLAKAGKSVIIPGPDQNFEWRIDAAGETNARSAGIPQVMYMENVLPTSEGFRSIALVESTPIALAQFETIITARRVRASTATNPESSYHLLFLSSAKILASYDPRGPYFQLTNSAGFPAQLFPGSVSFADVKGSTYFRTSGRVFRLAITGAVGPDMVEETITGLPVPNADIVSICGSFNYLIFHSSTAIYWSSTTIPTDFAPSLVSGAGVEFPNNIKSNILFLKPHSEGFFICCEFNLIFARYTGNSRYPWKFTEIKESGGYKTDLQIAGDSQASINYGVNTNSFIQAISPELCDVIAPEITQFLSEAATYDSFNYSTNIFIDQPHVKLRSGKAFYLFDRYVLVSYDRNYIEGFNEGAKNVFVYDKLLKRYGNIKINHDYVVESASNVLPFPAANTSEPAFVFIDYVTGKITSTTFNYQNITSANLHKAVILLGKFKLTRSRWVTLEEATIESIAYNFNGTNFVNNFSATIVYTLDGKTFETPKDLYLIPPSALNISNIKTLKYLGHTSCSNFSLLLKGAFDLNTVELRMHIDGIR